MADFDYGLYFSDGNLSKSPALVYDLPGTDELDAVAVVARTVKVVPDAPDAAKVSDDPRVNLGTTVTLRNSNIYADLPLEFKEILSPKIGTVVAVDFYDDVLYLRWTRNREINLAGYKIYFGTTPGQYTESLDVGNVDRFLMKDLKDGTTYYIALKAYNLAGIESVASSEVSATAHTPVVTSIEPNHGPTVGETRVTIRGSNFAPGALVRIGNEPAREVKVVDATTITASTHARPAGLVDVVVMNADEASGTLAQAFTYERP